ncbi:MAG: SusD/RagB family nutrient-binding outer membrane lipoprotein [Chitinophagaceae bacterium]|nr:MAG: SusD/RagB family nutrient-binding outer membrane lipoprotein [Chitinophagaceae bacterium]
MKSLKYFFSVGIGIGLFLFSTSCSKNDLAKVNKDLNDATDVGAINELPAATMETVFGTAGTDIAWYSSLFIEQSTGVDEQFYDADRRNGVTSASLMDNSWNSIYDNLMILNDMITKCSPGGSEPDNKGTLGIAQILTAYNLAVLTDMWGDIPWSEALKGLGNVHPKYDSQQDVYAAIFGLLNAAISNLTNASLVSGLAKQDLIYGGDFTLWTKAAWSLKARYFMRLEKRQPVYIDSVLVCVPNGFTDASDALVFNKYENSSTGANPWYDFTYQDRGDLCSGETLYNLMNDRSDPRMSAYFLNPDGDGSTPIVPAPNGEAQRTRAGYGVYSFSAITGTEDGWSAPTPLMSYHELLFLKAEALARKGNTGYINALEDAITANFIFHGLDAGSASTYFTTEVLPRLGTDMQSNLQEILTQKYIGEYEAESIEAYDDYRRTGIPQMHNPANQLTNFGFVQRYPYPSSEVTSNPNNIPKNINIFKDPVWWAK